MDPEVSEMKTKNSIKTLAEHIFGIYAERAPKTTQTNPKTKRKMLADLGLERVNLAENRRFFVGDGVMWMLWPNFRLLNLCWDGSRCHLPHSLLPNPLIPASHAAPCPSSVTLQSL